MKTNITWLTDRLPPIEKIRLRGEADYYGISRLIAKQLGYIRTPRSFAQWLHGWVYTRPIQHPFEIAFWEKPTDSMLVATQFEVETLQSFGYSKVSAVGLPFIYTRDSGLPRRPGTLLVMPAHSGSNHTLQIDAEQYIQKILKYKEKFAEIVACIHSSCVVNGYWIDVLDRYEIPWIVGASVFDRNALQRMRNIFQSFEYVTTNTIGSHIPYASYCGCKVSIFDYQRFLLDDYKNDPAYLPYPELLKKHHDLCDEMILRERFPTLFKKPYEAELHQDWAKSVLGEQNKRSPEELKVLLEWKFSSQIPNYLKHYFQLIRSSKFKLIAVIRQKISTENQSNGRELDILLKSQGLQKND